MGRPGAGLYPFLVSLVILSFSVLLWFRTLQQKETKPEKEEAFPQGRELYRVFSVALTLVFFTLALKPLGYPVSCAIFMGGVLKLFGNRKWGQIALISILTSTISFYLFAFVLEVPLPKGLFPF